MKFGARILKTGIAITIALYVANLFNLDPPAFAAIAAVFAIQPSVYRSYQTILEQAQGNIIGAVFAVVFSLTLGNEPFVIGLVSILVIAIIIKLKIEKTIPLAVVTVIVIMLSPTEDFEQFAFMRFIVIMVGVLSSSLVNLMFIPPKYENKLYHKITTNAEYITQWIRLAIRNDAEHKVLKNDLLKLKESMLKSDHYFLLYKEERNYFKRNDYTKVRKLVLFRQMLNTNSKALEILKSLDLHDYKVHRMPEEWVNLIQDHLDRLTGYHERILLKYIGKVRHQAPEALINDVEEGKHSLTETFLSFYNQENIDREQWMELFPLVGLIIGYQDHLEHLDKLIGSFHTYHQEGNEMDIKDPQFND
jgi:uncharacterized membrane protein YgaE (UPF0421/DUF939 family)